MREPRVIGLPTSQELAAACPSKYFAGRSWCTVRELINHPRFGPAIQRMVFTSDTNAITTREEYGERGDKVYNAIKEAVTDGSGEDFEHHMRVMDSRITGDTFGPYGELYQIFKTALSGEQNKERKDLGIGSMTITMPEGWQSDTEQEPQFDNFITVSVDSGKKSNVMNPVNASEIRQNWQRILGASLTSPHIMGDYEYLYHHERVYRRKVSDEDVRLVVVCQKKGTACTGDVLLRGADGICIVTPVGECHGNANNFSNPD